MRPQEELHDRSGQAAPWLLPPVRGIGGASLLSDLGHEVPTALLPSLLTSTLGAPAAALGIIEGVADGLAGAARLAGGTLADDPGRRRATAIGGYTTTAVLSGLIGAATSAWQVGALRAAAAGEPGPRITVRVASVSDTLPQRWTKRCRDLVTWRPAAVRGADGWNALHGDA